MIINQNPNFLSCILLLTALSGIGSTSHSAVTVAEKAETSYKPSSPTNMTLNERESLYAQADELATTYKNNQAELGKLKKQYEENEKSFSNACKANNVDRDLMTIIASEKGTLVNTLTSENALALGNLSRIVYENFDKDFKNFHQTKKQTELDAKISSELLVIEALKEHQKKLINISSGKTKGADIKLESLVKSIRLIDKSIELDKKSDIASISMVLSTQISQRSAQLKKLEADKKIQDDTTLQAAQAILDGNLLNNKYRVEGVFYRNTGEFSGLALYNQEENKLTLAFAGTKSSVDWLKNFFGWNGYADAKGGYFSDVKFHSGFISHFNDSFDSVMTGVNRWVEDYQQTREKTVKNPLVIEGTGHSLGGTQAAIFALAAKQLFDQKNVGAKVQAVTFGTPNMVHGASVEKLNMLFGGAGNFVRFEDSYDVVPVAAFWKDNPGINIRYNPGLFHDINGNLEIVPRNTHSSEDYYRFSATALKLWKEKVDSLKPFADNIVLTKNTIDIIGKNNLDLVQEANKKMVELSQLDSNNMKNFAEQFESYQSDMKLKIESLRKEGADLAGKKGLIEELSTEEYFKRMEKLKKEILQIQNRLSELRKSADRWKKESDKNKKVQNKLVQDYDDFFTNLNQSIVELEQSIIG